MPRTYGKLKKNENGTLTVHGTVPQVLSDDAIKLFEMGYTPSDWIRAGIREVKRMEEMF